MLLARCCSVHLLKHAPCTLLQRPLALPNWQSIDPQRNAEMQRCKSANAQTHKHTHNLQTRFWQEARAGNQGLAKQEALNFQELYHFCTTERRLRHPTWPSSFSLLQKACVERSEASEPDVEQINYKTIPAMAQLSDLAH